MKYLNLSQGFNPHNSDDTNTIKYESLTFAGGEPHIKIDGNFDRAEGDLSQELAISHRINSFNDLGLLLVAVDAIKRLGYFGAIHLLIPYMPGARQDRVASEGEALTIGIYAKIINSLELSSVTILDAHSDVAAALLDNVYPETNHSFVEESLKHLGVLETPGNISIVSPDAGANKKIKDLVKYLANKYPDHVFDIVKCDKTRDTKTGKLTGFEVHNDINPESNHILVDDICDGGGTFIGLATELYTRGVQQLALLVTHGIFSNHAMSKLKDHFAVVYTTDSIRSGKLPDSDNLTIIPLSSLS